MMRFAWTMGRACGAIALLAFSTTVLAETCGAPQPGWIFCEDFEQGSFGRWDSDSRTSNEYRTIVSDGGPNASIANHVLRMRVPAGRGGTGLNKTFTPSEYDKLYARWYVAYEQGFDFTAENHGHGLHAGDRWKKGVSGGQPQGNDWFTANVEYLTQTSSRPPRPYIYAYYRGMGMDCADPNGSCWGDHIPCMLSDSYCNRVPGLRVRTYPPALEHERWYCVELMIEAGDPVASQAAANGKLNLWIDETAIGPWENLWWRTSSTVRLNHFWLGLFHHGEHSVQGLKYDDVVVSIERIGCGSRTIPPAPPSNLRAQ